MNHKRVKHKNKLSSSRLTLAAKLNKVYLQELIAFLLFEHIYNIVENMMKFFLVVPLDNTLFYA